MDICPPPDLDAQVEAVEAAVKVHFIRHVLSHFPWVHLYSLVSLLPPAWFDGPIRTWSSYRTSLFLLVSSALAHKISSFFQ